MVVWGGLAILAGVLIVGTVVVADVRGKSSQNAPSEHHRCDAFKPMGDGKFQCIECGDVIDDVGDLP